MRTRDALRLLDQYHRQGGEPKRWMYDTLFNMHARKGKLDAVFAAKNDMTKLHGLELHRCVIPLRAPQE
jgi:hypothetical protein